LHWKKYSRQPFSRELFEGQWSRLSIPSLIINKQQLKGSIHPMPEIAIRPARKYDLPLIKKCVDDAFGKYIERIGKPPAPMLLDFSTQISLGRVWVAEYQGEVRGTLVIFPTEKGFYLDTIAVSPSFQGLGLGHALLQFAEQEAGRHGFTSIYLCTNVMMTENQTLYPKVGYVEYERSMEDGYDRIFYRKHLG
jgi:GNAT superfamily N-acetyltransferase